MKDGDDFVYVHVEASDEAGHDGDLELKLKTIENLDQRLIKPIFDEVSTWDEPVCIAVLPDHPTPVEIRTHVKEPVPFIIYYPGIEPDSVEKYDEVSCVSGGYGMLQLQEFMNASWRSIKINGFIIASKLIIKFNVQISKFKVKNEILFNK